MALNLPAFRLPVPRGQRELIALSRLKADQAEAAAAVEPDPVKREELRSASSAWRKEADHQEGSLS